MPCAHSPDAPRSLRGQHRRRRTQATDRSRGSGSRGAGRGAPRRLRSRGDGAGPGPASTPGSRPARSRRLAVLVGEVEHLLARSRHDRGEDRVRRRARGERHAAPQAEDRIQHRADRVRQWTAVDDRDRRPDRPAAAEETGAVGLVLDDPAGCPSTAATCAAQIGFSSPDRGRRVASSAPMPGSNSVCTNRFWNAGCATSAACGASTISAYDVSSISRALRSEVRQRDTRRISASCSAETTMVRPVAIEPSRRENSAWSSE